MNLDKIIKIVMVMGGIVSQYSLAMEEESKKPTYILPTEQVQIFDESKGSISVKENRKINQWTGEQELIYSLHFTESSDELMHYMAQHSSKKNDKSIQMWAFKKEKEDMNNDSSLICRASFPSLEMEEIFHIFHSLLGSYYFQGSKQIHIIDEGNDIFRIKEIDSYAETTVFCDLAYMRKFPKRKYLFNLKPVNITSNRAKELIENFQTALPSLDCFLSCYNRHGIVVLDAEGANFANALESTLSFYYAEPGAEIFNKIHFKEQNNAQMIGMLMTEFFYMFNDFEAKIDFAYFPIRNKAYLNGEETFILHQGQKAVEVAKENIKFAQEHIADINMDARKEADQEAFYYIWEDEEGV